ncbi:MAG: GGDEF domain-containing protein [Burkholderiales bacterium]|nr:GGDEF domain-containing protein [Burkholderiales bacterium]
MQRSRGGTAIHLPVWLALGWATGLDERTPLLFGAAAAGFGLIAALRFALESTLKQLSMRRHRLARRLFLALLLSNPALWGLLSAWVSLQPPTASAAYAIWMVVTGVSAAGGLLLSIDTVVRKSYAALAVLPGSVALASAGAHAPLFPVVATLLLLAYVYRASAGVYDDYWARLQARVELEEHARQLERLSRTDALTQVYNRQYFDRQLGIECARAARDGLPLSLVMIDIDHFKRVNDTYGHPFGDACLQAVARALRDALYRPADVLARYGGEEFIALLPATDAAAGVGVAARLHGCVSALSLSHPSGSVPLTCSVGLLTMRSVAHTTPAIALNHADQALYAAKQQGRNRVVVATPA